MQRLPFEHLELSYVKRHHRLIPSLAADNPRMIFGVAH